MGEIAFALFNAAALLAAMAACQQACKLAAHARFQLEKNRVPGG
jgi:hypothetical protein